jgi:hypothetical protein
LAIVHRDSLVHKLYAGNPKVLLCSFEETPEEEACLQNIVKALGTMLGGAEAVSAAPAVPAEHTARAMTRKLCRMFDLAAASATAAPSLPIRETSNP